MADSIPREKIDLLCAEREEWMSQHQLFMAEYKRRCGLEAAAPLAAGGCRGLEAAAPVAAGGCRGLEAAATVGITTRRGLEAAAPVAATSSVDAVSRPLRHEVVSTGAATSTSLRPSALSTEEYAVCLAEYRELYEGRMQKWLDAGYGSCALVRRDLRQIVEDALLHFDRVRSVVYSFVVMPNHVHVLFMPLDGFSMSDILRSWKGFTARELNRRLNRTGVFWQKESWDHLVRNECQFTKYLNYIKANDSTKAYDAYEAIRTGSENEG